MSDPQKKSRNHGVVSGLDKRKEERSPLGGGGERIVGTLLELVERNKVRSPGVVSPKKVDAPLRAFCFLDNYVI